VFVTDLHAAIDVVVGFYRQRAGAENLIKEANNHRGLGGSPFGAVVYELRCISSWRWWPTR
jgi:hypothetical protein